MPRCMARFSAGTSASGSLAETAMASTLWAMSALMTSIWPSAVVEVGPGIDDLDIAEFLCGLLRAFIGGIEEAVAERLRHEADPDRVGGHRRSRKGRARRQRPCARSLRIIAFSSH